MTMTGKTNKNVWQCNPHVHLPGFFCHLARVLIAWSDYFVDSSPRLYPNLCHRGWTWLSPVSSFPNPQLLTRFCSDELFPCLACQHCLPTILWYWWRGNKQAAGQTWLGLAPAAHTGLWASWILMEANCIRLNLIMRAKYANFLVFYCLLSNVLLLWTWRLKYNFTNLGPFVNWS